MGYTLWLRIEVSEDTEPEDLAPVIGRWLSTQELTIEGVLAMNIDPESGHRVIERDEVTGEERDWKLYGPVLTPVLVLPRPALRRYTYRHITVPTVQRS